MGLEMIFFSKDIEARVIYMTCYKDFVGYINLLYSRVLREKFKKS